MSVIEQKRKLRVCPLRDKLCMRDKCIFYDDGCIVVKLAQKVIGVK